MTALVDDATTERQHHEDSGSRLCVVQWSTSINFLSKSKSLIRNKESDWRWRKICRQLHARIHDCRRCALRRSWGLIHRLCLQRTREKDVRCDKRWRNPSIRASTTRGSWWYATFCLVIKNRYATTSRMDIQDQREDQSQRYDISHIHNCH